jgi:hypothetical protein
MATQDELPAVVATASDGESNPAAEAPTEENETLATAVSLTPRSRFRRQPGSQVFLPVLTSPLETDAGTAVLETSNGLAERQTEDGSWTALPRLTTLTAGQRIRTGLLSQATLTFYDGSQATLGPGSELTIEQLNAQRPEAGSAPSS